MSITKFRRFHIGFPVHDFYLTMMGDMAKELADDTIHCSSEADVQCSRTYCLDSSKRMLINFNHRRTFLEEIQCMFCSVKSSRNQRRQNNRGVLK